MLLLLLLLLLLLSLLLSWLSLLSLSVYPNVHAMLANAHMAGLS